MKIIHKDKWGFWFFIRYTFIVEDEEGSLTELMISKAVWERYSVGDFFDSHYFQFYKYSS